MIHTGLGKVNAAIKTTEIILKYQPKIIINYGTCGSINKDLSGLIKCTKFIQIIVKYRSESSYLSENIT